MPTPMAVFGIRVRARVGPQQLVPDEHRPRRAYETTNKQNPRPTSVEQQPRGARAASYGEGADSGGLWCRAPGTHVRKGIAIAVTFPGADVCSARAREDSFARIFCCGSKISKTKTTTAQKTSVEPPQESKGLLAARLRSVREPADTSSRLSVSFRVPRHAKQVKAELALVLAT